MFVIALLSFAPLVQDAAMSQTGPPVLSIDSIQFHQYVPQHSDPGELFHTAAGMIGRHFYVRERGGMNAPHVDNLSVLGDAVLVYDEESYARHVLGLLQELDREAPTQAAPRSPELVTLEYQPRYASMEVLIPVLEPFQRRVSVPTSEGTRIAQHNLSVSSEGNVLIVRDYSDEIEAIRAVLKQVDKPPQQVVLTCQLIQTTSEANGHEFPPELTEGLSTLLPGRTFRSHAYAMLRAGITQGGELSMRLESDNEAYVLSLEPVVYDRSSGTLTARNCTLTRNDVTLFRTDIVFYSGEYMVIGATGTQPTFLVARVVRG